MKKSFTLILFFFSCLQISFSQIIITEIMYNDPTSGTDTLEFIELYNNGNSAVNLDGYHFLEGVEDTLGPVTLDPGAYWVVAEDSFSMRVALGAMTDQWNNGALSNGGELIVLADNNGNEVDRVEYNDVSPWPSIADGKGPSLVLCDYDADNNDAANWAACSTGTGAIINGDEVFANPGADSDCPVIDTPYPRYDIGTVTTVDANGVPDSSNVFCEVIGVVVGINIGADRGDTQFTIVDITGGIAVFDNDGATGYTVEEGDEVAVKGFIDQFNGLAQIIPDSIIVISTDEFLLPPRTVLTATENTESELIRINGVHIVDTTDWDTSGDGFNVRITNGSNDTTTMRIDNDVDIIGTPVPTGTFDVIGIGGQFDFSEPFTDGYQILPRYMEDIITDIVSTNDPVLGAPIELYPNPTSGKLFIELTSRMDYIAVYNSLGMLVRNFQNKEGRQELDLSDQAQGLYYLRFLQEDKQWVEKVILE